jgi:AraC-like DNA-binding protein
LAASHHPDAVDYAELPPPPALAGIVRCFWHLTDGGRPLKEFAADPALPDGSPELIFNFGDPFEHLVDGARPQRQPAVFLVGQITRPMVLRPTGSVHLIAVRFEGHGASLLRRPMNRITNQWVGAPPLPASLVHTMAALGPRPAFSHAAATLSRLLERLMTLHAGPDPRVMTAVQTIRETHGASTADSLARTAGLTMRSLQRLFAEDVGISPKMFARIVRFQRVFAAVRDEPASLARVAAACGYYDQPHLIRDFRDFAGAAPAQLLTAMPEFTGFFTA